MKQQFFLSYLVSLTIYLIVGLIQSAGAATHPLAKNRTHICGVSDSWTAKRYSDQYPNRRYARASAANLNVGEPRTVRMIYFLPNDRPYRAEMVQNMKDQILNIQTFFAEQMEAHGYGRATFRIETDPKGEPKVHRVDGQQPNSDYQRGNDGDWLSDIEQAGFDITANIYLIAMDLSNDEGGFGGRWSKTGGEAILLGNVWFTVAAHELGHAFGLQHDFHDGAYIMSYGPGQTRLSPCHAEYLSVHPYFNPNISTREDDPPTIELISSTRYTAGAKRVPVRLKISDSARLHQAILFATTVPTTGRHSITAGFPEVKQCHRLVGNRDTVVKFDYDGVIPSADWTSLSDPTAHPIHVEVVDTDGNVGYASFTLAEISPYHIDSLEGHADYVESVSFSSDGTMVASGSWDGAVKLWDVTAQTNVATLEHNGWVSSVAFSPDGGTLASGSDRAVKLWDVTTRTSIATLEGHTTGVRSVSFSPDGTTVASGSGDDGDGEVKLWDVTAQTNIATLWHTDPVRSVSFSPDGTTVASGSGDDGDGEVKLWDVTTRTNFAILDGHTNWVYSVSFSPDGTILASGSGDRTVKLWDVTTQTNVATLEHNGWVSSALFSPDGTILASGSGDGAVKLWDVATQTHIATFWHNGVVSSVSFSPDGATLASATAAGAVELWDMSMLMDVRVKLFTEVEIPDLSLRAAIEEALGKALGAPITTAEMARLPALVANDSNISDLTGLEHATSLTELILLDNNISDISAVAGLTNLTGLHLGGNSITDISPIAGLINLTLLHLPGNHIADISPVARLTNLTYLNLNGTNISDLSPLVANTGLGSRDEVYVDGNPLSYQSIYTHIPALQRKGVTVEFGADGTRPPDVNGDGKIDVLDLIVVTSYFGNTGENIAADVSGDGVVDVLDLVLVAGTFEDVATAPSVQPHAPEALTAVEVRQWLIDARSLEGSNPIVKRGIMVLEQLLVALTPTKTELLANYPNPFNPETWIPYRLAEDGFVTLTIYDGKGHVVRTLDVGHRIAAVYESRSKAIYWDSRNEFSEQVASGVYFYHLSAGDYSQTRKMLILK